jgi:hypothetical protein
MSKPNIPAAGATRSAEDIEAIRAIVAAMSAAEPEERPPVRRPPSRSGQAARAKAHRSLLASLRRSLEGVHV